MTTTIARALGAALLLIGLSPFTFAPTLAQTRTEASALIGDIAIEGAWMRQPPPGARAAGGYATITNKGLEGDRLVGGSVPFAGRLEVHEMDVVGGVMRMSRIDGGLAVGPGETVELKPGGLHLMFIDVTEPPVAGTSVPVTLVFERAGEVTLDLPVAAIGAKGPDEGVER